MLPNPLAGFSPEKVGPIVAHAFEWCGADIFAAMQEALIDANFHREAIALAETWSRMNPEKMINHETHLSFSENGWILLHQGSPLCDYKQTYGDVLKVAAFYRLTLPDVTWNGDRAEWVTTNTIEETVCK